MREEDGVHLSSFPGRPLSEPLAYIWGIPIYVWGISIAQSLPHGHLPQKHQGLLSQTSQL